MSFVSTLRRVYQHPRLEHQILYSLAKRDYHAPRTAAEKSVLKDDAKPGEDLAGFVGKHFVYTYDNGWVYEWYCRNHNTCDYRIHRGKVGGRWVTKQKIYATKFKENIFKVDWHEPTGTCVSLLFDLQEASKERIHGTIFFPQWIGGTDQHPEKTILYQNEFIDQMKKFRDEGPAYPYVIIPEFATICTIEDRGVDNDDVIKEAPGQMEKEPVFDQPQGDK